MTTRWHCTAGLPVPSVQLAIWSAVGATRGRMVMVVWEVIWLVVMFLQETRMKQTELGTLATMPVKLILQLLETQLLMVSETWGWKAGVLAVMAAMGWKVPRDLEALMKFIENWVWARERAEAVMPLVSKRALKAEMEASVVRLRLAVWQMMVLTYWLVVVLPLQLQKQFWGEVFREHELPQRSMIWLIYELEALTKKQRTLLRALARMVELKETQALLTTPQACMVKVMHWELLYEPNWVQKYPQRVQVRSGRRLLMLKELIPAAVAGAQPTLWSLSPVQIWVRQSVLLWSVSWLNLTQVRMLGRVMKLVMGAIIISQQKQPGALVVICMAAKVFWMLEATMEKVGTTLREGALTMLTVVQLGVKLQEAALSPPRLRVTGMAVGVKAGLEQKETQRWVLLISNCTCSKLISWLTQKSPGGARVVLYWRLTVTEEQGGLGMVIWVGREQPPRGTVKVAGKEMAMGTLVTKTAYSLRVLQQAEMEVSFLARLKVQVVGMRF